MSTSEEYRQMAAAARRAVADKPWAATHLRTCASYWDNRARRAEQPATVTEKGQP